MFLTFLIPVYQLNYTQKRNLRFIYERLVSHYSENEIEIIFGIQDKIIDSYYSKFNRAKIVHYPADKNTLSRSDMFDICYRRGIAGEFLVYLDPDIYFSFKDLRNRLAPDQMITLPFHEYFSLDGRTTSIFLEQKKITLKNLEKTPVKNINCIIFNKKIFSQINSKFFEHKYNNINFISIDNQQYSIHKLDLQTVMLYNCREKPTVAIITPSLGLGGAEIWIRNLITYCTDYNWIIGVLSNHPRHDLIVDNVVSRVIEIHGPEKLHKKTICHDTVSEIAYHTVSSADAVIVWGGGDYWPLPTDKPVIFVGHGTCQWTVNATKHALSGGARHFVAVSNKSADVLRTVVDGDVKVIMNGVDTSRLKLPNNINHIRRQWKPDSDPKTTKYVGYIGRLGNEKNIDSIIHSVAALPFHFHLVLIGCTGWRSEPILLLARTLLRERLIEVPATDNIGEALGALDCLVQVSPREGNSLAICEAMFCRVPIISNMTGALPELEAMAGTILVEHLPDVPLTFDIACAIRNICQKPPVDRIDIAENFARTHLTAQNMCQTWTNYINNLIS